MRTANGVSITGVVAFNAMAKRCEATALETANTTAAEA
jgi:hypothetical protein